jgi:hypothetical protein
MGRFSRPLPLLLMFLLLLSLSLLLTNLLRLPVLTFDANQ